MHPSPSWLHRHQGLSFARSSAPSLEARPSLHNWCGLKLLFIVFLVISFLSFPRLHSSLAEYVRATRNKKLFSQTKVYDLFQSAYKASPKSLPNRQEAWLQSYGDFSKPINLSKVEAAADIWNFRDNKRGEFCDYTDGQWVFDASRKASYSSDCPFSRTSWKCAKNQRPGADQIVSWRWIPKACNISSINGHEFLTAMRNRRIGFIGDSLNENFMVSLLCILRRVDRQTQRWKRRGAWKGAFFPSFNVTIGYHRAVLLAEYSEWKPESISHLEELGLEKAFRVDVDVPASSWMNAAKYYDVFIFNTGHWWSLDKFPPKTPLLFFENGKLLVPLLNLRDGLEILLKHMIAYVENNFPVHSLKLWRTQSPRHFFGGDWNENGSCIFYNLLTGQQVETWFEPRHEGVNREVREINQIILHALRGTSFHLFDVAHLSEFRADAHPAIWLGRKDAHVVWGQDCLHWCLPGLPDTWVDILAAIILHSINVDNA